MPPKVNPVCIECKCTESLLWRTNEQGQICQECFQQNETRAVNIASLVNDANGDMKSTPNKENDNKEISSTETKGGNNNSINGDEKRLRKSTRATRYKSKPSVSNSSTNGEKTVNATSNKSQIKGRSRRTLFKKIPYKTPVAQATTHSVQSVFHKGSYLQIGDIVSLVDNNGNVYYAQIRGLLVDEYCEKSAFLTWLIPTQESPNPKEGFDAATYLIGPDEELPRKLSCLEFVMHAPSNYYLDRSTPFPLPDEMDLDGKSGGYVWTTLPEVQRNKTNS